MHKHLLKEHEDEDSLTRQISDKKYLAWSTSFEAQSDLTWQIMIINEKISIMGGLDIWGACKYSFVGWKGVNSSIIWA